MKSRLLLFTCILLCFSLSCKAVTSIIDEIGAEQGGKLLFQDDFSNPKSGWKRVVTEEGITDYDNGTYRIFVDTTNTDVWSNPGLKFSDTVIEVEATKVGGDDNNDFGLICRYQDNNNFYFFVISSDGYYGIGKLLNGKQMLIGMESMPPSEVIKQGNATNVIRGECVGKTLRLIVNGELLAETVDDGFSAGDVGLLAGSFDVPGTDIRFDNFIVREP